MLSVRMTLPGLRAHEGRTGNETPDALHHHSGNALRDAARARRHDLAVHQPSTTSRAAGRGPEHVRSGLARVQRHGAPVRTVVAVDVEDVVTGPGRLLVQTARPGARLVARSRSATHVCVRAARRVGTSPRRTPQRPRMPCPPLGPQALSEAFFLSASLVRRGTQGDVWAGKGSR